ESRSSPLGGVKATGRGGPDDRQEEPARRHLRHRISNRQRYAPAPGRIGDRGPGKRSNCQLWTASIPLLKAKASPDRCAPENLAPWTARPRNQRTHAHRRGDVFTTALAAEPSSAVKIEPFIR